MVIHTHAQIVKNFSHQHIIPGWHPPRWHPASLVQCSLYKKVSFHHLLSLIFLYSCAFYWWCQYLKGTKNMCMLDKVHLATVTAQLTTSSGLTNEQWSGQRGGSPPIWGHTCYRLLKQSYRMWQSNRKDRKWAKIGNLWDDNKYINIELTTSGLPGKHLSHWAKSLAKYINIVGTVVWL